MSLNPLVDSRDVRFVVFEMLEIDKINRYERFTELDRDMYEDTLNLAEKIAVDQFLTSNADGDKIGLKYNSDTHEVKVPESFHKGFKAYIEAGFHNLAFPPEEGGMGMPVTIAFASQEYFNAGNTSLGMYCSTLTGTAHLLMAYGSEEVKKMFLHKMITGEWCGTMCITEPGAGSDVGALKTKAVRQSDGTYLISGQKIFISNGEHDLTPNIIHPVLARIEGDPEGTKGISIFIVPKVLVNKNGSLGERNDMICSGIEHKMGMKGSATAVLNFGDNGHCIAELLGPERKGIQVMFHMMNEQRILVGMQGMAQAGTAYLHALNFAKERKQGAAFGTRSAEQTAIIGHPDVRRNLLWMKAYTEGMRALILYTMYCMDLETVTHNKDEKSRWHDLVEILTPICKAYCSDKGFETCVKAIQIHGGYGYCHEYKVEQCARDSKITSIYEGTNAIQALDLFDRKIRMKQGAAFEALLSHMKATVKRAQGIADLSPYASEIGKVITALEDLTVELLAATAGDDPFLAYSWASPYLEIFGDVVMGWMLIWQAAIASGKIGKDDDAYYT